VALLSGTGCDSPVPFVMKAKVAIIGFAETTRDLAPFSDPDFTLIGMNHLYPKLPKRPDGTLAWDIWFDMHAPEWSAAHLVDAVWKEHEAWLKEDHGRPIFMLRRYDWVPCSVEYPLAEVIARFGRQYFTSGVPYMIALALLGGVRELHLYGIDMRADSEYGRERPCAEWWLGLAEGLGVKVVVPEQSALLAPALYGYEEEEGAWAEADRAIVERLKNLERQYAEAAATNDAAVARMQTLDGAKQEANEWLRRFRQRSRGGVL
jgi:hypothetical protein